MGGPHAGSTRSGSRSRARAGHRALSLLAARRGRCLGSRSFGDHRRVELVRRIPRRDGPRHLRGGARDGVVMPLSHRVVVLDHGEKLTEGRRPRWRATSAVITAYLGDRYRAEPWPAGPGERRDALGARRPRPTAAGRRNRAAGACRSRCPGRRGGGPGRGQRRGQDHARLKTIAPGSCRPGRRDLVRRPPHRRRRRRRTASTSASRSCPRSRRLFQPPLRRQNLHLGTPSATTTDRRRQGDARSASSGSSHVPAAARGPAGRHAVGRRARPDALDRARAHVAAALP